MKVLVVDDDSAIAEMVGLALRRGGHDVAEVPSGECAQARLADDSFDVVVSDLRMGAGMDGWGLARWVRQHTPTVGFVLLTAEASFIDPNTARRQGAATVLGKPMRIADLLRAVADAGAPSTP